MKILIILFLFLFMSNSFSIEVKISRPCDNQVYSEKNYEISSNDTVGDLTIKLLAESGIPFIGAKEGFNSIFNSPIGLDAMDIISDDQMRAYGWCYTVDGEIPEVLPNKFILNNNHQEIHWFYGFAFYRAGVWESQCEDSSEQALTQYCLNLSSTL